VSSTRSCRRALAWLTAAAVGGALLVPVAARSAPPLQPLDPQHVQDQQDMTWGDYHPIPGLQWSTNGALPTDKNVTIALVAFDFPDQPFVITEPKKSDPFGNPQIDPVARADVPKFYADFYNTPSALNHNQTINGYWMEQSGGRVGITKVDTYGPYQMPKRLDQYGVNDIGQNHGTTGNGCSAYSPVTGAQSNVSVVTVTSTFNFYPGDIVTFSSLTPTGTKVVDSVPDATHLVLRARNTTLSAASALGAVNVKVASVTGIVAGHHITVDGEAAIVQTVGTAGAGGTGVTLTAPLGAAHASGTTVGDADVTLPATATVQDCLGTNFDSDAAAIWQAQAGCTTSTNCGHTIHLFMYAGYDETSVWQEFGEMKFQTQDDVPRAVFGNPNPLQPSWVISRYVPWTSWRAGEMQWGESSIRQGESSGTITHEISHNIFSVGDNNNNPYVTPYHRVGSGTWDMMDRGSFNGPGGPHNRWEVPAQQGASMGAEHTLRNKIGFKFVPYSDVLRLNRNGLASSGLAVADVIARAVNAHTAANPLPTGVTAGAQVTLDGTAPVDHEPACNINTDPLCDSATGWTNYTVESVQRIGYGSFEPDSGVLIAKNKPFPPGGPSSEGATCGFAAGCFTWVEDAHPEDINQLDFNRPDGTPVMRTIGDYRQLNDALFHAGTNSGSQYEYVDGPNNLHIYVLDKYTDANGIEHHVIGVQNPAGAGPQKRGVALSAAPAQWVDTTAATCHFPLTNSGVDAPTDPALHPQDETAFLHNDIYRLTVASAGAGWSAQLRNALATARFGDSVDVPVYVTRSEPSVGNATITLTATSVSDTSKTATATCLITAPTAPVGGTVPATLSLTLGAPATFGTFTPGLAHDYTAATSANVISTAGDATLSVADPSSTATGHLVNGAFSLPSPLQAQATSINGSGSAFAPVGSSAAPTTLLTYTGPASNDSVGVMFKQTIGAGDALRTGTYSKTLTFTLSTTTP
jgi:M6 family metalloprotease-like protein